MDSHEYAIALLKPEGLTPETEADLLTRLDAKSLRILESRVTTLSAETVEAHFVSDFDIALYARYLASGPMKAFLVEGDRARIETLRVKRELRAARGLSSADLENLLHSVDSGSEYFHQFPVFFPEKDIRRFSSPADFGVHLDALGRDPAATVRDLLGRSNLSLLGILASPGDRRLESKLRALAALHGFDLLVGLRFGVRLQTERLQTEEVPLIAFYRGNRAVSALASTPTNRDLEGLRQWCRDEGGSLCLDYLPYERISNGLLQGLRTAGVRSVFVFDPRRTLSEAEDLDDRVPDHDMTCIGGTHGRLDPGMISIGVYETEKFLDRSLPG